MKKILFLFTVVASLFVTTACTEYLDVTPSDKQTASQLFSTKSGFYSASNGIYDALSGDALYGKSMTWYTLDLMGLHYTTTQKSLEIQSITGGDYASSYALPYYDAIWSNAYSTILAANLLIDEVKKQEGILSETEANVMIGEMLGVRAFLHLDMLRLYGPVPSQGLTDLSIPYNESSQVTVLDLLPFNEVIEKIIADLDEAESILSKYDPIIENGPMPTQASDGSSINLRYRQYRMNYYAVKALKARAYLWAGDKENALAAALSVINDPKVQEYFPAVDPNNILANNTNPDRVFSSETFFGVYDKDRDEVFDDYFSSSTAPQSSFLQPYASYLTTTNGLFAIPLLGSAFGVETSDYRYQCQWELASGTGVTGHQFIKYRKIAKPDASDEDSEYFYAHMISLLRISELYLIAAECDEANFFTYYNEERSRRGIEPNPMLQMYAEMYMQYGYGTNYLLQGEYCREFYGEGQMFYVLKRLPFMSGYDFYAYYNLNGSRQSMDMISPVVPLPLGEMK